jgi:SAM-dependent methyltransferase
MQPHKNDSGQNLPHLQKVQMTDSRLNACPVSAGCTIPTGESKIQQGLGSGTNPRVQFTAALTTSVRKYGVNVSGTVLILGGSCDDAAVLQRAGFRRMTLTNIESVPLFASGVSAFGDAEVQIESADAEGLHFPDNSYDLVLAHEVLHHCRSPHAALLEMVRVTRRHVVVMEPHDSLCMKALEKMRLATFPYELAAVVDHDCVSGGMRDSCIPNFVYRWNRNEVFKTVSSFIPDRGFKLHADPYWDLSLDEKALSLRKQTKLHVFTGLLGPRLFLRSLRVLQRMLNAVPILRHQGNKFFCCVEKREDLRPWLIQTTSGIAFNRRFAGEVTDAVKHELA